MNSFPLDPLFCVNVISRTPNPQTTIWCAMHQDFSENYVFNESRPSETKAGEIAVKRLLSGNRGHYGCLEHPQITFNCGWFPHSVMQQARTHRVACCLSGETIVTFGHPSRSEGQVYYSKSIHELADLWHKGRSHQSGAADAAYMQKMIKRRRLLQVNEDTGHVQSTRITNIYLNGVKAVNTYTFANGFTLKCTKEHMVFTPQGWRQMGSLVAGEQVFARINAGRAVSPSIPKLSRQDLASERWAPIKGYEWYEISTLGRVRSWAPRKHRNVLKYPTSPKLKTICKGKYLYVGLSRSDGSGSSRLNVHTLVADTFLPSPATKLKYVRHVNGNSYDNRLSNLSWGDDSLNASDRKLHDVEYCGRSSPVELLSVSDTTWEETYDLEVEGPFHNFLGNGIVVHNSFDVQSMRYTGQRITRAAKGEVDLEEVFYVRPAGEYTDRFGKKYQYTESDRNTDLAACLDSAQRYAQLINKGVAEEHARSILVFDFRQHFVVSFSLRSLLHFLDLRAKLDAQLEIRQMCELIWPHLETWTPEIAKWYAKARLHKAILSP